MKVDSVGKVCSFKGIVKPYMTDSGIKVIPISHVPEEREIKEAIKVAENRDEAMEGYNGRAYFLGEDLVVKHYKGKEAFSDDPYREINMLDGMYDAGLKFRHSQQGSYAFITPDNECYTVSTKVEGANPEYPKSPFTKENLKDLVDIITRMDTGSDFPNSSKNGLSDRCRFMNYDFNGGNIKVTPKTAGVFDFEYSVVENLDDMIKLNVIDRNTGANCHRSDTSPVPSSLRSFEFYTFCDYLKKADNADEIFEDYLEIKGNYHSAMSEFYEEYSLKSAYPEICRDISEKEAVHSRLLKKDENGRIPVDIKKSEALKIQMSNFMHEQSQFCDTGRVNPQQLKEFTLNAIGYFLENASLAAETGDNDRAVYYDDCLELFSDWKNVNKTLAQKIKDKDPQLMRKLTNEHIKTLQDVID